MFKSSANTPEGEKPVVSLLEIRSPTFGWNTNWDG